MNRLEAFKRAIERFLPGAYRQLRGEFHALRDARESARVARIRERVSRFLLAGEEIVILGGPFKGMKYLEDAPEGSVFPKIAGTYEKELHPLIEEIVASDYKAIVNIGSAEGYYAVGLARRASDAVVYACDIDPAARIACAELARLNEVDARVVVGESFDRDAVGRSRSLFIVDCEGCERDLLDPEKAPELLQADLLVELHEFIDPTIRQTLHERFSRTHESTIIDAVPRTGADAESLDRQLLSEEEWQWALNELRPSGMSWGWYRRRSR